LRGQSPKNSSRTSRIAWTGHAAWHEKLKMNVAWWIENWALATPARKHPNDVVFLRCSATERYGHGSQAGFAGYWRGIPCMKIRYHAWLRHTMGRDQEDVVLPAGVRTVGELLDWLPTQGER